MSNVGYDLDTSGGLMPLIRALIKPPDEDGNGSKSRRPQHPYYKRPGKGHNHDSCDACGEGGDLICCDRCPASFHLGCYDPPLEENDIPAGQWLCKECHSTDVDKPTSSRSSRAQSPSDSKSDTSEKRTSRSLRTNRTDSTQTKKKGKDETKDESQLEETAAEKNEEKEQTPMEILVKAALIMNPKQFDLPNEMKIPCLFPGTDKEPSKNGNGSGVVSVDAWGCVPLPARSCFVCRATCKLAPLLQCDYCPLLFHQDCLDPPLTALPTGRWMCPNHVEQYVDWKMVNSISATERVALWDQFSAPVDQHAVKIDFIRRARNHRPAFRQKIPVGVRGRVVVPAMVRHHYRPRDRAPLLPSRREYVRCRNVLNQLKASGAYSESEDESSTQKHQICMNLDCPQYRGGECPHKESESETAGGSGGKRDTGSESKGLLTGVSERDARADLCAMEASAPSDSESDLEELSAVVKRRRMWRQEGHDQGNSKEGVTDKLRLASSSETRALLAAAERQLDKLDRGLVTLLAWQRLQQILAGSLVAGAHRGSRLDAATEEAVSRSIDRAALAKFGFKHVALPSQLLTREDQERISTRIWGEPSSPPGRGGTGSVGSVSGGVGSVSCVSGEEPGLPRHSLCAATLRATLCHVQSPSPNGLGDSLGPPLAMRLSSLTVGSGACDVSLRQYARCRHVSPHHATIFYDEVTRHFELMNYSEWGTRVNGVLYACELTPRATSPVEHRDKSTALEDVISHRRERGFKLNGPITVAESAPCRCPPARPLAAPGAPAAPGGAPAWEGTALLPHGALIQTGCIQFVFSIAQTADDSREYVA